MTGPELQERRSALNLSRKQFADAAGVDETLIDANEKVGVIQGGLAASFEAVLSRLEAEAR